jgi:quinoprotein glucose dehydrogenase
MKYSPLRITLLILALFFTISLLGGSAIWTVLGLDSHLVIDGHAEQVGAPAPQIGDGWPAYGGDAGGNRFSSASEITRENVARLEIAWTHRTGALEGRDDLLRNTAFETTPILADGSLIFCTQFNQVIALDPGTGEEKWRFDPEISTELRPANQYTCRGVSYWQDETAEEGAQCASRVLTGTADARLIALDSRTGELCPDFGEDGEVRIEPSLSLRWPGEFQITSAPAIIGDIVVTGSAISDNLRMAAPQGTVHGFDIRTGELVWRFNPVPRDPNDPARASWEGDSADVVGHANVWSTIAVDNERELVFLPTSSASPDYFGGTRGGDNNYANSIVALHGATGEIAWHFQTVHHDVWDYDLPAQPSLTTVWRDGAAHDVVVQVAKTGLVFVLDRETGEPFLPIEERAVPQGGAEGEQLSPTQPFPVNTPPVVPNRLRPFRDAFGVTLWDRLACASSIRNLRGDGLFTPPGVDGMLAYPFSGGGANWGGAAYDPTRNLLVINMSNAAQAIHLVPNAEDSEQVGDISDAAEFAPMEGVPFAMTREMILSPFGLPCNAPPWGVLAGIDLASGEIVWRHPLGTTEDLAPGGLALRTGVPNFGGPMVTAGDLIFIGATMDDYLRAFDVETGEELWKGRLPAGGQASPMTYVWEGRQFVVIAAGGHSSSGTRQGDHVVAFALPQ